MFASSHDGRLYWKWWPDLNWSTRLHHRLSLRSREPNADYLGSSYFSQYKSVQIYQCLLKPCLIWLKLENTNHSVCFRITTSLHHYWNVQEYYSPSSSCCRSAPRRQPQVHVVQKPLISITLCVLNFFNAPLIVRGLKSARQASNLNKLRLSSLVKM